MRTIFKAPPREVRAGDLWRRRTEKFWRLFEPDLDAQSVELMALRRAHFAASPEDRAHYEVEIARAA